MRLSAPGALDDSTGDPPVLDFIYDPHAIYDPRVIILVLTGVDDSTGDPPVLDCIYDPHAIYSYNPRVIILVLTGVDDSTNHPPCPRLYI